MGKVAYFAGSKFDPGTVFNLIRSEISFGVAKQPKL